MVRFRHIILQQLYKFLPILLVLAFSSSCADENDEPQMPEITPQVIFLFSPGGLGDMSYNDCILEGVQRFKKENPHVDVFLYSPDKFKESERIFNDWLARPGSNIPVLFVFASSDYDDLVAEATSGISLAQNKKILVFESRREFGKSVSSFQISMYGASYLAGVTAASISDNKNEALIVLANPTDSPISLAKEGFIAGYGKECTVEYLADDWTGYISASLAYKRMSEWGPRYNFIFPVAGGSNSGIYRYSREYTECPYLAGMDIDQSYLSNRITGCVVKHIDQLVYNYLNEWLNTGNLPLSEVYGLESGYIDWQLSPAFHSRFEDIVEFHRQEAINMEKEALW